MYVSQTEGTGMDALAALGIVLPITLIMQAFAKLVGLGGAPRAGIKLGERHGCGYHKAVYTVFFNGFDYVFCANDTAKCKCCSGSGEVGAYPCGHRKGNNSDSALFCADAFSWI